MTDKFEKLLYCCRYQTVTYLMIFMFVVALPQKQMHGHLRNRFF